MNHSQATIRDHVISTAGATAFLVISRTRARAALAALLAAGGLLLPAAASAQQADGERLFRQRCGACHSLEPGQNRAGPHLSGVIGRTAGSVEGARYSAALRESGIVWEGGTLDTFLTAPRQRVPGTSMTVGVPDAAQRAAIIVYLEGAGAQ
jgi:cytochrome c